MAGFHYNLQPKAEQEERYDVKSGVRRRGPFALDCTGFTVGSYIPSFTPICADLVTRKAVVCVNCTVLEDAAADATTIKVAKNSYVTVGMTLGTGAKGAPVASIDKTNEDYDVITLTAAFGAALKAGAVLFEASAAGGTKPKHVANSALYENYRVTRDINLVALLHVAFEIEPTKLATPFNSFDKEACKLFQFNE